MSTKYTPDELIVEILKRLPAKSLLRFVSASESWYSLIKNPSFISYHFNHQINQEPKYLLYRNRDNYDYHVYLDNKNFDMHLEFTNEIIKCLRVACSNGMVCFLRSFCRKQSRDKSFVLWNSSLRKSVDLEVPHRPLSAGENIACWFGFDEVSNDYKLVWVGYSDCASKEIRPFSVHIYSLNERSWRCVNSSFSLNAGYLGLKGVYMNRVIHWVFDRYYENRPMPEVILTFNLEDETFGVCNLPSEIVYVEPRDDHCVKLMTVKRGCKNCLAVIHDDMTKVSFWVMEEEGEQESWIKDFSINSGGTRILNARMNGEIVMEPESGGLVSFDHRLTRMNPLSSKYLHYAGTYTESLLLLL